LTEAGHPIPRRVLDLGSGGGLPGMVLAVEWPTADVVLLDSSVRRVEFLNRALEQSGLTDRVTTECGRAEELGHRPDLREAFAAVVARSFGPPATTAECGAPFCEVGGALVISSPPEDARLAERWPTAPLEVLGLGVPALVRAEYGYVVLTKASETPERYPRRVGVPRKRPLF
jgi:16S rRNA (guanine527-N7)-methyltransferase